MNDFPHADPLLMRSLALVVFSLCAFVSAVFYLRERTVRAPQRALLSAVLLLGMLASPMALDFLVVSGNKQPGLYIDPSLSLLLLPAVFAAFFLFILVWRAHAVRNAKPTQVAA